MNYYQRLGVKTYINAWGTVTRVGGSLMDPAVMEAMAEASRFYIDLEDFHRKAGRRIAGLIGVEDAFVSSGAAAGIAISTAACIAGTDVVKINQLPDTAGMRNEIIILKSHRSRYDQGIRLVGGVIKEVGYADLTLPEQLSAAITERTAMCFYLAESENIRGSLPLRNVSTIMKSRGIPVLVDAAAEIPPRENLTRFIDEGADLVVFSGGKDIRGPQSSGLVVGNAVLIEACRANSCPNHSVGRGMKVDKETLAGILRAVELYMAKDMIADMERMEHITDHIISGLSDQAPDLVAFRGIPTEPGIQPRSCPRVYVKVSGKHSTAELKSRLGECSPAIICGVQDAMLVFNSQLLSEEDAEIIVRSVKAAMRA